MNAIWFTAVEKFGPQSGQKSAEVGLLSSFELARMVQQRLRIFYPGERHADCYIWAIWKMVSQVSI
jgi:hypothetical protein